jgi:hypothetical protein
MPADDARSESFFGEKATTKGRVACASTRSEQGAKAERLRDATKVSSLRTDDTPPQLCSIAPEALNALPHDLKAQIAIQRMLVD